VDFRIGAKWAANLPQFNFHHVLILPLHSMTQPAPPTAAEPPRLWALIPCAGTGSRAGGATPKQYQDLAGQPMVFYTLAAFDEVPMLAKILVVVTEGDEFFASNSPLPATFSVAACGGSTRAGTVFNGLNWLLAQGAATGDWVLVHDAARCLITPAQIQTLIDNCQHDEVGGLLAHPLPDTLKSEAQGRVVATINRSDKWLAQTPQMFRIGALKAALQHAGNTVTDEASAMEAVGLAPKLVPGGAQNFKITYPEDFALAQAILLSRQQQKIGITTTVVVANPKNTYDYP
jgi:2-C-methyl-D-erythritol 4-phosphate cytidylyltransferase